MTARERDPGTPPRWVAPLRAQASPRRRVVVFAHAGAGPTALVPAVDRLPADIEVLGVTLPGRGRRIREPFGSLAADPGAVVAAVLAELAALPPLPTAAFGHSMGAALATAAAAAAPDAFAAVVVSAYPGVGTPAQRAARWSDDDLLDLLRRGAGTPDEVLANPLWRRHLLDQLRGDLTLGVRLAWLTWTGSPLAVPLTVLAGEDDGVAPDRTAADWRPLAGAGLRLRRFPGGHFYLLDQGNRAAVAAEVTAALTGR